MLVGLSSNSIEYFLALWPSLPIGLKNLGKILTLPFDRNTANKISKIIKKINFKSSQGKLLGTVYHPCQPQI